MQFHLHGYRQWESKETEKCSLAMANVILQFKLTFFSCFKRSADLFKSAFENRFHFPLKFVLAFLRLIVSKHIATLKAKLKNLQLMFVQLAIDNI